MLHVQKKKQTNKHKRRKTKKTPTKSTNPNKKKEEKQKEEEWHNLSYSEQKTQTNCAKNQKKQHQCKSTARKVCECWDWPSKRSVAFWPGNGKTLSARAVANRTDPNFYSCRHRLRPRSNVRALFLCLFFLFFWGGEALWEGFLFVCFFLLLLLFFFCFLFEFGGFVVRCCVGVVVDFEFFSSKKKKLCVSGMLEKEQEWFVSCFRLRDQKRLQLCFLLRLMQLEVFCFVMFVFLLVASERTVCEKTTQTHQTKSISQQQLQLQESECCCEQWKQTNKQTNKQQQQHTTIITGIRHDDGAGGDNEVQRTMLEIVN